MSRGPLTKIVSVNTGSRGASKVTVDVRGVSKAGAMWRARIAASDTILIRDQEKITILEDHPRWTRVIIEGDIR